jgi:4-amino-4-deoxy-L-arabinose transferase-like glycosyltransferase
MTRLTRILTAPLTWLAVAYLLTGFAYAWVTPGMEKPDEQDHYGYLRYVREHRAIPPLAPDAPWLFESKQPPLYYLLAALVTAPLSDVADPEDLVVPNPYLDHSVPGYREDNRNVYLHPPRLTPVVFGARLVSLLFGLGTLLCTYALVRQLLPEERAVALAGAAVVGFQTQTLFMATALNNDAATAFAGTATLLLLVIRIHRPGWRRFPLWMGLLLGLACLVKVSALVFFPLVGLTLLLVHGGVRRELIRDVLIIGAVALLVGGWWYLRNTLVYGDPLTLGAHLKGAPTLRPFWSRVGEDLRNIERTFWGNQARVFVSLTWLDQIALWWGRLGLAASVIAVARRRWALTRHRTAVVTLLAFPLTFAFLLIAFWARYATWAFSRFLQPAIAPIMLGLLWAWSRAVPLRWRRPVVWSSAGLLVTIGVLTPWLVIHPLFTPHRAANAAPIPHPNHLVFQDAAGTPIAALLGHRLPQEQASPGSYAPIDLCWEPLNHTDTPYALYVNLLDLESLEEGQMPTLRGSRQTYPGLGSLPTDRWPLDTPFCSMVLVRVAADIPVPSAVVVQVGFVDPVTNDQLVLVNDAGDPAGFVPLRGLAIVDPSPVGVEGNAPYRFGDGISLHEIEAHREEGQVVVTTTWESTLSVPYDAVLFVHVADEAGRVVAQRDRQPLRGRYPTSYWVPGSTVVDVMTIPTAKDDQAWHIHVGMYTWPDAVRLPIVEAGGASLPDRIVSIELPDS